MSQKRNLSAYDIVIRDLIAGMSLEESKAKFTKDSISAREAKTKAIRVYKIEKILRDFYLAPDRSHDLSRLWIYIEKHAPTESNYAKLIVRKLLNAGWKPEEQVASFFLDEKWLRK
jgi:hypothetical protein